MEKQRNDGIVWNALVWLLLNYPDHNSWLKKTEFTELFPYKNFVIIRVEVTEKISTPDSCEHIFNSLIL